MELCIRKAKPYVIVFEEPAAELAKLKYRDGEVAEKIIGINSSPHHTTYSKICAVSLLGTAYVRASCVTVEKPYRPHPHNLVSQGYNSCKHFGTGIIMMQIDKEFPVAEFRDMWLQYTHRDDVREVLATRKNTPLNPLPIFEWDDSEIDHIDLTTVRLSFEIFYKNPFTEKLYGICRTVSQPICNIEKPAQGFLF